MIKMRFILIFSICAASLAACKDDTEPVVLPADYQEIDMESADAGSQRGVYILNEGNMGANKASLDFVDYSRKFYIRNIYGEVNPNVVMELGDAGNDLKTCGDRLYAVITGSNKVEVMDSRRGERIGQVDIFSPRYITFDGNYGYVSSYVGGEGSNGSVVRFNLSTLAVEGSVSVGLSPEEMVIVNGKLYVANSANFADGTFDNTLSVIDLATFTKTGSIEVAPNLHHLKVDSQGRLWVNSRGNYFDIAGALFCLERTAGGLSEYSESLRYDKPVSNFCVAGDDIFFYATSYDENWNATYVYGKLKKGYGASCQILTIINNSSKIQTPYDIAVHPDNGDIYITDAVNYTSSGKLWVFDSDGNLKWDATTCDIPGHVCFVK